MSQSACIVDGSRKHRTKDEARRIWYAKSRAARFARHMGFTTDTKQGK